MDPKSISVDAFPADVSVTVVCVAGGEAGPEVGDAKGANPKIFR